MDYAPYEIEGRDRPGRWLVTCDHAANTVPDFVNGGSLGIAPEDMARHIAYDVGAAGVARALAAALDAPAILTNFSRLVIDPNRGEEDPTLVMQLYDGTIIPANRGVTEAQIEERLARLYRPYHDAYETLATRPGTVIVAIHSFTPQLKGRPPRPWEVAVLYSHRDARFSKPLISRLQLEGDLTVGDNQPYSGHLPGDSIACHALDPDRQNTLIEVRNDLIATPETQHAWGMRLAGVLDAVRVEGQF